MIGQLPPDFFHQFFSILAISPAKTLLLETQINDLCQRQWLQAQMDVLPDNEQRTFGAILTQDGIKVSTLNDFLEQRLDESQRQELWAEAQLKIWSEILKTVEEVATQEQRKSIKSLVATYRG